MIDIRVFYDTKNWIQAISEDFIQTMDIVRDLRQPRLCLAGGQTPEPVYRAISQLMIKDRAGLRPAILVPGDERVPSGNPDDLNETMLSRSFAPALESGSAILYSWFEKDTKPLIADKGHNRVAEISQAMIRTMEQRLGCLVSSGQPLFDLCYLGLGADCHTAGLFPGMPGLKATQLCISGLAPTPPRQRVSLGFLALTSSARTRFIVRAAGKEAALKRLASGDQTCPAVLAASENAIAFVLA